MMGVVLAGGQSRRMGQDKAMLRHANGQTWLARSIELLGEVCDEVWVSGRTGARSIIDPQPFAGPAAAIVHCCQILDDDILFIPVDLPLLTIETLRELCHHTADAVHYANHPLPLLMIGAKKRVENINAPQNMSVYQLLAGLNVHQITPNPSQIIALTNVNYP